MSRRTSKNKFHCKSEAQKKAIRKYYAQKAAEEKRDDLVDVCIKTHKDKNGGHPHVIVDEIDNNHVSVGLSTKKYKGKGANSGKNYTLEKSPLDDGKQSYMRRQGTVAPKKEYDKPRQGTLTHKDYNQAKVYGERAKEKYIKEKGHKKK